MLLLLVTGITQDSQDEISGVHKSWHKKTRSTTPKKLTVGLVGKDPPLILS